jgi:hypothetical protein
VWAPQEVVPVFDSRETEWARGQAGCIIFGCAGAGRKEVVAQFLPQSAVVCGGGCRPHRDFPNLSVRVSLVTPLIGCVDICLQ